MNDERIAEVIETQWERLAEQTAAEGERISLQNLIAQVRCNDALGRLYPFLSVGRLCFSRCIDFPYYVDVVISALDTVEERYAIERTVGQGGWAETDRVVEVKTAEEAARRAAALLPTGYGSALAGNAEDHRSEFNRMATRFRELTPRLDEH